MLNLSQREKILVIDDEPDLREIVSQILSERYQVYLAPNAEDGLVSAQSHNPSLVVMDLRMPGLSGIEACRKLRANLKTRDIPVVMLTASDELEQRIEAFEAGVDDFVSKPFSPEELLARVNSKIRRVQEMQKRNDLELVFGDIRIFPEELRTTVKGEAVDLGPSEFKIIVALARACGELVSRESLAELIWGSASDSRSLDPLMSTLRKKLRQSDVDIKTVYRAGYALVMRRF